MVVASNPTTAPIAPTAGPTAVTSTFANISAGIRSKILPSSVQNTPLGELGSYKYDVMAPPQTESSHDVSVGIADYDVRFSITDVIRINEARQTGRFTYSVEMKWTDPRLRWNCATNTF